MSIDGIGRTAATATDHRDIRTQFAALCFRKKAGEVEVLLITSRETQRWVVPKGWPMPGRSPVEAAETEAWEEAGVRGRMGQRSLGLYTYTKVLDRQVGLPCVVALFPLQVREVAKTFPERRQRRRKWFPLKKAATKVDEPELAALIAAFDPVTQFP